MTEHRASLAESRISVGTGTGAVQLTRVYVALVFVADHHRARTPLSELLLSAGKNAALVPSVI